VERVNNAKHYVTLRIVDNTATVQQGAKIAEVTLVPAQPNQDSVIYFNVEALDRYQSDRDVQKMIKEVWLSSSSGGFDSTRNGVQAGQESRERGRRMRAG
jgi:hypothetical protein